MRNDSYTISNLTPCSDAGEITALIQKSDLLKPKAQQILDHEGLKKDDIQELYYAANFHPASQDVRLRIVWSQETLGQQQRTLSIGTNEQNQIIAAISQVCEDEYGLSPEELIENARKEDERRLLNSVYHSYIS